MCNYRPPTVYLFTCTFYSETLHLPENRDNVMNIMPLIKNPVVCNWKNNKLEETSPNIQNKVLKNGVFYIIPTEQPTFLSYDDVQRLNSSHICGAMEGWKLPKPHRPHVLRFLCRSPVGPHYFGGHTVPPEGSLGCERSCSNSTERSGACHGADSGGSSLRPVMGRHNQRDSALPSAASVAQKLKCGARLLWVPWVVGFMRQFRCFKQVLTEICTIVNRTENQMVICAVPENPVW